MLPLWPPCACSSRRPSSTRLKGGPPDLLRRYATLLSTIARKESVILEVKNTLATHEQELADLRAQWRVLAATNAAPGVSHPQPSVMDAAEGLLGTETVQSGKRLLNLVLGVGGDGEESGVSGASPSPSAQGKVRRSMSGRSSADMRRSLSGLEQVNEAEEESGTPYSDESPAPSGSAPADVALATSPPTSKITPGRPRAPSSAKRLSHLSNTSTSSQSSVDTASWLHGDNNAARVAEEDEQGEDREVKGLMSDLAGNSAGGWGAKLGNLAAGLNSNEQYVFDPFLPAILCTQLTPATSSLQLPPIQTRIHVLRL